MKKYAVLFLMFLSIPAFPQATGDQPALVQAATVGLAESREVRLADDGMSLVVGEFVIPVSSQTHVKPAKRKATVVEFSLQQGTAITNTNDPSWKRAFFSLEFKSRDEAKKFVEAFRKAAQ
jgi:hypothetical protein